MVKQHHSSSTCANRLHLVCVHMYVHRYASVYVCLSDSWLCVQLDATQCMYVCMYVCVHVYVHTYVCMYVSQKFHSWTLYVYVCMYVYVHVCAHFCKIQSDLCEKASGDSGVGVQEGRPSAKAARMSG